MRPERPPADGARAAGGRKGGARRCRELPRPSKYSRAIADRICERIAEGEGLRAICSDDDMPGRQTVLDWLNDDRKADFRARYLRAREAQADFFDEEIHLEAMAATPATATVSKLRIDTMKWRVARLAPKKYGEREPGQGSESVERIERVIVDPQADEEGEGHN